MLENYRETATSSPLLGEKRRMHLQVWAGKLFHPLFPICVALSLLVALIRGGEIRCWQEGNFRRDSLNLSQAADKCLPGTRSAPEQCKALQAFLGVNGGILSCVCCCSFPAPVEVTDPAPLGENHISTALGAPAAPARSSSALGAPAASGSRARALPFPAPCSGRISSPLGAPAASGSRAHALPFPAPGSR